VLAGAVVGRRDPMARVAQQMKLFGGTLDAQAVWLLQRGLKTLELRLARQSENALGLARWLDARDDVVRVWYPGLASHPDHERASRLLSGHGAMLAFELADWPSASDFLTRVRLATHGASLGGLETLVVSPARSSHAAMDPVERRERFGIADGLIRVSVGIEGLGDLIADFTAALEA
ncbi:MAG: PLP-dependent transferase, partial [Acidobacteriota bacterium]